MALKIFPHLWSASKQPLWSLDKWMEFLEYHTASIMWIQDNYYKWFQSWANVLMQIDKEVETLRYSHLVTHCRDEDLDNLGAKYNVAREGMNNTDYRNAIKIAKAKRTFVPTLDNIINLIKDVTDRGYIRVETVNNGNASNLELDVFIEDLSSISNSILVSLDEAYTSGKKINFYDMEVLRHDSDEYGHDRGIYTSTYKED